MPERPWYRQGCSHAPNPGTITVEGEYDALEVTIATSTDPKCWPRIALCKVCGRGIRLRDLLGDWTLVNGGGEDNGQQGHAERSDAGTQDARPGAW